MRLPRWILVSGLLIWLSLFPGCSDNPGSPSQGTVSALVTDSGLGPVADVEITLSPGGIVAKTNRDGVAVFHVAPGRYFVDAHVCCIGPGWIEYHLPVTVREGETVEVEMQACLVCV